MGPFAHNPLKLRGSQPARAGAQSQLYPHLGPALCLGPVPKGAGGWWEQRGTGPGSWCAASVLLGRVGPASLPPPQPCRPPGPAVIDERPGHVVAPTRNGPHAGPAGGACRDDGAGAAVPTSPPGGGAASRGFLPPLWALLGPGSPGAGTAAARGRTAPSASSPPHGQGRREGRGQREGIGGVGVAGGCSGQREDPDPGVGWSWERAGFQGAGPTGRLRPRLRALLLLRLACF